MKPRLLDPLASYGVEVIHHFSGREYGKETRIPEGVDLFQHKHTFDHLAVLAHGRVKVTDGDSVGIYDAPHVFTIKAGTVHAVRALSYAVWICVHATTTLDADAIDSELIQ